MEKIQAIKNKIIPNIDIFIAQSVPIIYFLISIIFYLKTYDSAQIKITLIQIGGTMIIAAWLAKLIEEHSWDFFKKNSVLIVPLALFLVSGLVSYIHSPFPYASANEFIRRVIYIFFAVIVIKEFNSEDKFNRLFKWLFAAAFVACIYGLVQYLDYKYFPPPPEPGLDPFIWRGAFGSRVFSTFGNPNFFGDFLVVMSPITLAMYLKTRKFSFLFLWALIIFNTYVTGSKGAWLGFAAGLLVFAFLAVGFFLHADKGKIKKIIISMVLATIVVVSLLMAKQLKERPDSASFRLFTWTSTWEMINTNPILGTGIGSFYVTYPAWRRPQIFFIEGRHNTETDHPEDEYLEIWYDEGLIGIGIFLWIITTFLFLGFSNLKVLGRRTAIKDYKSNLPYYQLGVLTAISAQLVHNFVCVSLRFVSSGVFLWLLIGLIGALNLFISPKEAEQSELVKENVMPKKLKRVFQAAVVLAALYFIKIFYGYFDADVNHNIAIFYSKQGQWLNALKHYEIVVKENPSFIMAQYFMGNVFNDRWGKDDSARSIEKYRDVWELAPNYVQSHHQAGLIYLKWGEDEKRLAEDAAKRGDKAAVQEHEIKWKDLWNKALYHFDRYRLIDPIFPLNYYRIAWIYENLGMPDKAEAAFKEHIEFPKQLAKHPYDAWVEDWVPRRASEYAETYMYLGTMKYKQDKLNEALAYFDKGLELAPNSVPLLKNAAGLYAKMNILDKARDIWIKLRTLAPNDPDVQNIFGGR